MPLDPELDCYIVTPGQCVGCERPLEEADTGRYCRACLKLMRREAAEDTAQAQAQSRSAKEAARAELAQRELCRRRLLPFVKRLVHGYKAGWFHIDLAARLERFVRRVERGESPRMLLSCPPRTGKSEMASKALVAWDLGRNPSHRIISATHSDRLAMDNSRDVLNYMKHERYRTVFPGVSLDKDNKAASGWRTEQGGAYKPIGAGAGIAGYGADILVIDDPHRDQEAYSPTVRDNIWRWYTSSAATRLMPGGGILVIQTRWTLDDLIGRLIDEEGLLEEGGKWERINFPAVATADEYRLPDGRIVHEPAEGAERLRKKGEALHPDRYPLKLLEPYMRDPVTWQALYQGAPVAGEAALFTVDMLRTCLRAELPEELTYYITGDLAVGQKESSHYSAIMVGGVDAQGTLYIVDLIRDRFDVYDVVEELIALHRRYRPAFMGLEKMHFQVAVRSVLEKTLVERKIYGLAVEDLEHGNKDKVTRARPFQARVRQGKVVIVEDAPWFETFKKELLEFPAGRFDDAVDCASYLGQILDDMVGPRRAAAKPKKSWRDRLHRRRGGRRSFMAA